MAEAADELRALCVGHPYAKVPWPHRPMNEAADLIDELVAALEEQVEAERLLDAGEDIKAMIAWSRAKQMRAAALARAKGEPDA